ncbi:Na+/H+ antiporter subunit E, partial [Brevibacterium paucivorans]
MTNQKPESQKSKSAAARTADRKALRWALVRQ